MKYRGRVNHLPSPELHREKLSDAAVGAQYAAGDCHNHGCRNPLACYISDQQSQTPIRVGQEIIKISADGCSLDANLHEFANQAATGSGWAACFPGLRGLSSTRARVFLFQPGQIAQALQVLVCQSQLLIFGLQIVDHICFGAAQTMIISRTSCKERDGWRCISSSKACGVITAHSTLPRALALAERRLPGSNRLISPKKSPGPITRNKRSSALPKDLMISISPLNRIEKPLPGSSSWKRITQRERSGGRRLW